MATKPQRDRERGIRSSPKLHSDVRVSRTSLAGMRFVVVSYPAAREEVLRRLTPAEREVARLAAVGKTNLEIARCRGTKQRTVANQLAAIFRKLAVGSRAELALVLVGAPVARELGRCD